MVAVQIQGEGRELAVPFRNPGLLRRVRFLTRPSWRVVIAGIALVSVVALFVVQVYDDVTNAAAQIAAEVHAGIMPAHAATSVLAHSTPAIWLIVVITGAIIFAAMWPRGRREGQDLRGVLSALPEEADGADASV